MVLDGLRADPLLVMMMLVLVLFMAACAALLLMESRKYTDKGEYPLRDGKRR